MEMGMIFLKKDLLMLCVDNFINLKINDDNLNELLISNTALHNKMLPFIVTSKFNFNQIEICDNFKKIKIQDSEIYTKNKNFFRISKVIEVGKKRWDIINNKFL
jgi:hypothetical protein